ncbi:MAG: glycosyltransferase family 117 protein [Gemmatimonadaceae bacterium]
MTARLNSDLDYRRSYLAATIASATVFLLYLVTLGPSTAMWDTSEYIAAAHIVGLPHPPGNPFFVLLGRLFSILPIAGSVAARVNLLAALCAATSAGMWFLITERVLVSWLPERWQRITASSLAALIGATAFTVWSQAVVNEKVYTVALAGVAVIAWLTVRWCGDPEGPKADKLLVLIAYLLGLGYANHMAGFLAAPSVGAAVLIRRPATLLRWRLILVCAGAVALGVTPFATQPIRSAYFPRINEGETTGCRTEIGWTCTFSKETWRAFKYNFDREQYAKPSVFERQAPFTAQVGMWWMYFKWQWLRDPYGQHQVAQGVLAALFLLLGLFGGWVHWKRHRQSFWFFGPLMFTMTLLLIYYLNFNYGASQAPAFGDSVPREVRDRDYFYLWSFSAWSVWAALGLVFIWESLAALIGTHAVRFGKQLLQLPTRRSWALATPILALAFIPLFTNWYSATRAGDSTARDFAHDLLNSVEPYGVLITMGDNDTFPLWYAQEVEGIRKDVVIANTSLLNTEWYVRQLIRQPDRQFDSTTAPELWKGKAWTFPRKPLVSWSLDDADRVPPAQQVTQRSVFEAPGIRAEIEPRVLSKAEMFVLQMIRDSADRPIYFSRTTGGLGNELGLGPYLMTQGLARKLLRHIPTPGADTVLYPGEGFVDLDTTARLWKDVYQAPRSLIARDRWIDGPSANIPATYMTVGVILADVLRANGDNPQADAVLAVADSVARATRLNHWFKVPFPSEMGRLMPADTVPRTAVPLTPKARSRR